MTKGHTDVPRAADDDGDDDHDDDDDDADVLMQQFGQCSC